MEVVVGGTTYKIDSNLGKGAFATSYKCINKISGQKVAIKTSKITSLKSLSISSESKALKLLGGSTGFTEHYYSGIERDHTFLVMELVGTNLEKLKSSCMKNKLSLKMTLIIADQLLYRIEYMHKKGILHRDIKPANIAIGLGDKNNILYLIDFGLSKKYVTANGAHVKFYEQNDFVGTPLFASLNAHLGNQQSRRDDLESLAYVLIYLLNGTLPWVQPQTTNYSELHEVIYQKKSVFSKAMLENDIPDEFITFLEDVRNLQFEECPKYSQYRQMFRSLFNKCGFVYDYNYDWNVKAPEIHSEKSSPSVRINISLTRSKTAKAKPVVAVNKQVLKKLRSQSPIFYQK